MDIMRKLRLTTNNLQILSGMEFYVRGCYKEKFDKVEKLQGLSIPSDVWKELIYRMGNTLFSGKINIFHNGKLRTKDVSSFYPREYSGQVVLKKIIPFKDETRFGVAFEIDNCGYDCGAIFFLEDIDSVAHIVGRILWDEFAKHLQGKPKHILTSDWNKHRTGTPIRLIHDMCMCESIISYRSIYELDGKLMVIGEYLDYIPTMEVIKKTSVKRYKKMNSLLTKLLRVYVEEDAWNEHGFGGIQVVDVKGIGDVIDECCVFGTTRSKKDCICIYRCNWNGYYQNIRCYSYSDVKYQIDKTLNDYFNRAGHLLFHNFGRIDIRYEKTIREHQTFSATLYDNEGNELKLK